MQGMVGFSPSHQLCIFWTHIVICSVLLISNSTSQNHNHILIIASTKFIGHPLSTLHPLSILLSQIQILVVFLFVSLFWFCYGACNMDVSQCYETSYKLKLIHIFRKREKCNRDILWEECLCIDWIQELT